MIDKFLSDNSPELLPTETLLEIGDIHEKGTKKKDSKDHIFK